MADDVVGTRGRVARSILNLPDAIKHGVLALHGRAQGLDPLFRRHHLDRANRVILGPVLAVLLLGHRVDIAGILEPADQLLPGRDELGALLRILRLEEPSCGSGRAVLVSAICLRLLEIEDLIADRDRLPGQVRRRLEAPKLPLARVLRSCRRIRRKPAGTSACTSFQARSDRSPSKSRRGAVFVLIR
jgi:hypothetical protein